MKGILVRDWVKTYDELVVSSDLPVPRLDNDAGGVDNATIGHRDVLVDVVYAGLNFVDTLYCRGKHQNNRTLVTPPFVLGVEFAGIVRAARPGSKFARGDRVFGGGIGAFAEQIVCDETRLLKVLDGWSLRDAAAMAATVPVSYGALVRQAQLQPGETVLVHAAAGGLGIMAVQIAKALDCTVIATVGNTEKAAIARRYGADHVINYTEHRNWEKRVLGLTDGRGVNVTFDSVGLVEQSIRASAYGARVLIIGFVGREGNMEKIATNRVLLKSIRLLGYRFGEHGRQYPDDGPAIWAGLKDLMARRSIQPVVYHELFHGLESVVSGLHAISSRRIYGKALITVQPELDTDATKPYESSKLRL